MYGHELSRFWHAPTAASCMAVEQWPHDVRNAHCRQVEVMESIKNAKVIRLHSARDFWQMSALC